MDVGGNSRRFQLKYARTTENIEEGEPVDLMKANLFLQNQWGVTCYDVCTAAARSNLERGLTCISRLVPWSSVLCTWGAPNCYAKGPLHAGLSWSGTLFARQRCLCWDTSI